MTDNLRRILRTILMGLIAGAVVMADKLTSVQDLSPRAWIVVWLLTGVAVGNSVVGNLSEPPR